MTKREMIAQLEEAASLLELVGEPFRARAYLKAARALEGYPGDVGALLAQGRLTELPGIGTGLAAELAALQQRPTLPALDALRAQVPAEVQELLSVSGLGAKRIAALWQAGITGLEGLMAAADDGRLARLKGFGAKSAAALREAAAFALAARGYLRLDEVEALLAQLEAQLHAAFPDIRLQVTGEYRRRCEVISRLELIVGGVAPEAFTERLRQLCSGELSVRDDGLDGRWQQLALRLYWEQPGIGLLVRTTGASDFVAALEAQLTAKGRQLGEFADEAAAFSALGLAPIPPERRELPELVAPELITLSDIRGLVHNHSDWSDGQATIAEMAERAWQLGYRYLGIADHSRSSAYAGGLSIERVAAQAAAVAELRRSLPEGFALLHGLEVDILSDGALDYPDELLAQLDYVVVSIHQHFGLPQAAQTERIIRAITNPYADILGHATGRLLLRRPGYAVDLEAVLEACAATGTIVELNANPRRLDLDWRALMRAKALGCQVAINPDAHAPAGLEDVRYGVMMARKAGLSKADIVNTAPDAKGFLARLKRHASRAA